MAWTLRMFPGMDLTLNLHRDELTRMLQDFLPMRLMLGKLEPQEDVTWIEIDTFDTVTFLPGYGVAATCAARIHYPLPLLPDDFTVQHVLIEMVPKIEESPEGTVLAFRLVIGELDIDYLPAFVDRVIADKINSLLHTNATTIAWNFTKSLTRTIEFPPRLALVHAIELSAPQGAVHVAADGIAVKLWVEVGFHHTPEGPVDPCPTEV